MSNGEILTMVLNALPKEWGSFTSNTPVKKEAMAFQDIWYLCKKKETKSNQANINESRREIFGKFGPQKKKIKNMI